MPNLTACQALNCEFVGSKCTVSGDIKDTVTCKQNKCFYEYGCYINYDTEDVMAVMLITLALYIMLFLYCIYLLRKDFFSKKRLIDKLDDITLLVCILLFASLFRGIVVVVKKTAYDSKGGFVIEALSEIFQVSSAFYFVYFGRQLTTKVIREKTMVIESWDE